MLLRICMAMVQEKVVPSFFDIGKALWILAGELDESFDICIDGFLGGDLDEDPRPSNCI